MIINDTLVNQLISNPVFKTDTRAIFFLLQNPEPVSSDDIATATGLSRKCANKAVKRLTGAGLIQPGEAEARKRAFGVTGWEPQTVTEGTTGDFTEAFTERLDRIEAMIGALLARPVTGAILEGQNVSAPDHEGIEAGHKVTQAMTIPATDKTAVTFQAGTMLGSGQKGTGTDTQTTTDEPLFLLQDKKEPESIPKGTEQGTTGTKQATNGIEPDTIVSDLDDAITCAGVRLAALKAASLLKEKQSSLSDTCSPASISEVFKSLFGVQAPVGSDPAAVGVMIARKKAGKLEVKSPLAYLASLAGKVQSPILAAVSPPPALPSVTDNRLSHADMARIDSIWDAMDKSQYKEKAMAKDQTDKKYPVPVELLARSIFNAEMMAKGGIQ